MCATTEKAAVGHGGAGRTCGTVGRSVSRSREDPGLILPGARDLALAESANNSSPRIGRQTGPFGSNPASPPVDQVPRQRRTDRTCTRSPFAISALSWPTAKRSAASSPSLPGTAACGFCGHQATSVHAGVLDVLFGHAGSCEASFESGRETGEPLGGRPTVAAPRPLQPVQVIELPQHRQQISVVVHHKLILTERRARTPHQPESESSTRHRSLMFSSSMRIHSIDRLSMPCRLDLESLRLRLKPP